MNKFFKNFLMLLCMVLSGTFASAQGLEGVNVEVYYESNAATSALLPVGSKTYRVYVNLAPGYTLQAVYGDAANDLVFSSTANFFNDPDNGGNFANDVVNGVLSSGAALVDSWFSFGSGGGTRKGTLKVNDADGGIAATPLTNSGGTMGSPLTTHDGRFNSGATALAPSSAGVDLTTPPYDVFNNATVGSIFTTAGLAGGFSVFSSAGAATGSGADNRVLIGQFTTTGAFGYRLNLQLGTPTPGVSENYLANTAAPSLGLVLEPNLGNPTVAIPGGNITQPVGTMVTITATASDVAPGTITQVQFFNGATLLGTDLTSPYEQAYTVTGTPATITAVATDNQGATATSNAITVGAAPNVPPTVVLAAAPSTIVVGDNSTLTATAADSDGTIVNVKFYSGALGTGTLINTDATAPYEFIVTPVSSGAPTYYAIAEDNSGATTTSNLVTITVNANQLPTVSLTAPATNTSVFVGDVVNFTATAADADGTIANVEFLVDGVVVGSDNSSPYSYAWTSTLTSTFVPFVARATDNKGGVTTSASRTIRVRANSGVQYEVREVSEVCNNENICVPITAIADVTADEIIGFDIELKYNNKKVAPTGVIRKGVLAPANFVETSFSIKTIAGNPDTSKMLIAVYFNSTAALTERFKGLGDIICVEFAKRPAFGPAESVKFDVNKLQISNIDGVDLRTTTPGNFSTFRDTTFDSSLKFWVDRSPIGYVMGTNHLTTVFGSNASCTKAATNNTGVTPNINGEFTHVLKNDQLYLSIEKDIAATTDVLSVINGFDALLTRKVILEDLSFIPTTYQILAMDVNLDGVISAGDVSQINQRAVLQIGEYRQKWNYTIGGASNGSLSKDWLFVEESKPLTNSAFTISATYPRYDGTGYNKDNVPTQDFCAPTPVSDWTRCPIIGSEVYIGYLLGDVNGNWASQANSTTLRSNDAVIMDLAKATVTGNKVTVPVMFNASNDVNSVDFSLQFNEEVMTYVFATTSTENGLTFFNENDRTLRLTSNSINAMNASSPVAYITFETTESISERDFASIAAYINGDKVDFNVVSSPLSTTDVLENTTMYPNPATDKLTIVTSTVANVTVYDMNGRVVRELGSTTVGANSFDISSIANGVYTVKIAANDATVAKKLLVTK